jgi:hypothetical protein
MMQIYSIVMKLNADFKILKNIFILYIYIKTSFFWLNIYLTSLN